MEEFILSDDLKANKVDLLSRDELLRQHYVMKSELGRVVKELYDMRKIQITSSQLELILNEQLADLQNKMFGSSSEKHIKDGDKKTDKEKDLDPKPKIRRPSERYPHIPVRPVSVDMDPPPTCGVCSCGMCKSGFFHVTEQLTVIPKKYEIIQTQHTIYRCKSGCHMVTSPGPDRIRSGSSYSDEMILDVILSKYCDLIPIERQADMAKRQSGIDIPPQSLIELTHYGADFFKPVYKLLESELLVEKYLNADETPHRMLEGDDKKSWYLWGFSSKNVCYFECHNTRSGDVASQFLIRSLCEFLMSDVFSGYSKAVRIANEFRLKEGRPLIKNPNCNSHSRRYFSKAYDQGRGSPGAEVYLDDYQKIYDLEAQTKGKSLLEKKVLREQMSPIFTSMRDRAKEDLAKCSYKGAFGRGLNYFIENFNTLTLCLDNPEIPLDNNAQERAFRSPVVGRKTWYGTHSKRGAETAAILFSIVETCKLVEVNPREYFEKLSKDMLGGYAPYTPMQFKTTLASKANEVLN